MPFSSFEFTSWLAYQRELFLLQASLSSIVSTETLRVSHLLRNAFTNEEAIEAKASLARISALQERYQADVSVVAAHAVQAKLSVERPPVGWGCQ
jgi:hypothetical protein